MAEATAYEELRRRQVEENKRKLDELRLHSLSAAVRDAAKRPPTKTQKPKAQVPQDAPRRWSGRVASHPEHPDYSDADMSKQLCKKYLPERDEMIVLVDEMDDEHEMFYNADKHGLYWINAGWRRFAIDHNLADGDCLVFQLIERTKFKVYITRAILSNRNGH